MPKQKPYKRGKYTVIPGIIATQLKVNQMTTCRTSGRYNGCSIGRDKDGFFVFTHRAASKRYPTIAKIPVSTIKWIASTG